MNINIISTILFFIFIIGVGGKRKNCQMEMECSFVPFGIKYMIPVNEKFPDSVFMKCDLHAKSSHCRNESTYDKYRESFNKPNSCESELTLIKMELKQAISKAYQNYSNEETNIWKKLFEELKNELKLIKDNSRKELSVMKTEFSQTIKGIHDKFIEENGIRDKLMLSELKLMEKIKEKTYLTEQIKKIETTLAQSIIKYKILDTNFKLELNDKKTIISEQNKTFNEIINVYASLIRNGDYPNVIKLFTKLGESELNTLITAAYDDNVIYTEQIIDFLNSFLDNEKIILGYRYLFDQMIKNQHIHNTATTSIAYRTFVDFNRTDSENINLKYLKLNLPESLRNYPWCQTVVIRNEKLNQFIYFYNHTNYYHDQLRLIPVMVPTATSDTNVAVNIIPTTNGKYFYIKNKSDFYYYAETDEYALDRLRRGVFGWMKKNEIKDGGEWQLEPIPNSKNFKIKNVLWNQYLSISEEITMNGNHFYQLFTLRSGKCNDDLCTWNILKFTGNECKISAT